MRKLKVFLFALAMVVGSALPAFATAPTRETVKTDIITEATPYFTTLIGVVIALFGLVLLVALARKGAGMAKGAVRKG
jgi:hypothetical protein